MGRLAAEAPKEGDILSGLVIAQNCSYTLIDAQDLDEFTGSCIPVVTQKQRLVIGVAWELVRWHLEGMFGKIEERVDGDVVKTIRVCIRANSTGTFADSEQGDEHGGREAHGRARSDTRMGVWHQQ